MYSQTRKLLKGGGIPRCQCSKSCIAPLFGKSPFCKKHAKKGSCPSVSPLSGWEPHYMPTLYNGAKKIQTNHNCFAYAFDIMDPPTDCKDGQECRLPFHQPGYSAGYPKFSDSGKKYCGDLLARLLGDMPWLRRTTFEKRCRPGHSKIALVIDPDNDYHFYRQDSNGLWSHKPGGMPVTNRDASGKLIYNPALCDRDYRKPGVKDKDQLNYSVFCSFLCVPRTRPVTAKRGGGKTVRQLSGGGKKITKTMTKKAKKLVHQQEREDVRQEARDLFPESSILRHAYIRHYYQNKKMTVLERKIERDIILQKCKQEYPDPASSQDRSKCIHNYYKNKLNKLINISHLQLTGHNNANNENSNKPPSPPNQINALAAAFGSL